MQRMLQSRTGHVSVSSPIKQHQPVVELGARKRRRRRRIERERGRGPEKRNELNA